jgi:hypothetical protein
MELHMILSERMPFQANDVILSKAKNLSGAIGIQYPDQQEWKDETK